MVPFWRRTWRGTGSQTPPKSEKTGKPGYEGPARDSDKLRLFDGQRKVVVTMAENLVRATPEQRREFVLLLVERAVAFDKAVQEIRWVAPARPFFGQETARIGIGQDVARPARLELTTFRSAT